MATGLWLGLVLTSHLSQTLTLLAPELAEILILNLTRTLTSNLSITLHLEEYVTSSNFKYYISSTNFGLLLLALCKNSSLP